MAPKEEPKNKTAPHRPRQIDQNWVYNIVGGFFLDLLYKKYNRRGTIDAISCLYFVMLVSACPIRIGPRKMFRSWGVVCFTKVKENNPSVRTLISF